MVNEQLEVFAHDVHRLVHYHNRQQLPRFHHLIPLLFQNYPNGKFKKQYFNVGISSYAFYKMFEKNIFTIGGVLDK